MEPIVLFKEKQRFTQWWLWLFLIALSVFALYGAYKQLILGEPFGSKPMSDLGLVVFVVFTIAFVGMFYSMALTTTITKKEINVRLVPFFNKTFLWSEVEKAEVINYGFVGGWGIRVGTKYGTVYNMTGDKGLAIELKSGKKYVIGSQDEDDLKRVIHNLNQR